MKEIYLAGGCFWGMEAYFNKIKGVEETEVGYADGNILSPTYEQVCSQMTNFAETLKIIYDEKEVSLDTLLTYYFRVIDPVSVNRQGADIGTNYRTGIYYVNKEDLPTIESKMDEIQKDYIKKLAVEVKVLENYYPAEEYHQNYLEKNPGGYCHINLEKAFIPVIPKEKYPKPDDAEISRILNEKEYDVLIGGRTDPPFKNKYDEFFDRGIYVDALTGEPLFSSRDKFDSGSGRPAFSKPIAPETVYKKTDTSLGMVREEVLARNSDGHLGHVFQDGPEESGGLRYCINSNALRFVYEEKMEEEGYGYLLGEL